MEEFWFRKPGPGAFRHWIGSGLCDLLGSPLWLLVLGMIPIALSAAILSLFPTWASGAPRLLLATGAVSFSAIICSALAAAHLWRRNGSPPLAAAHHRVHWWRETLKQASVYSAFLVMGLAGFLALSAAANPEGLKGVMLNQDGEPRTPLLMLSDTIIPIAVMATWTNAWLSIPMRSLGVDVPIAPYRLTMLLKPVALSNLLIMFAVVSSALLLAVVQVFSPLVALLLPGMAFSGVFALGYRATAEMMTIEAAQ